MFQFLDSLEMLHQGFWYISLISSLIFLVQTIFTFIGSDGADGISPDFDGDFDSADAPSQLFSFRNLINFLLGFGWSGVSFYDEIENKAILIILSSIIGVVFVLIFIFLIKQILKFSEDNTFKIQNLIGETGEVYLTIPSQKSGKGKILISLKGTQHELPAITSDTENLTSGSLVKVIAVENQILIVEKI